MIEELDEWIEPEIKKRKNSEVHNKTPKRTCVGALEQKKDEEMEDDHDDDDDDGDDDDDHHDGDHDGDHDDDDDGDDDGKKTDDRDEIDDMNAEKKEVEVVDDKNWKSWEEWKECENALSTNLKLKDAMKPWTALIREVRLLFIILV